jgi:hypothetical protein
MARDSETKTTSSPLIGILSWLVVGLPLLWGVALTATKAAALFR